MDFLTPPHLSFFYGLFTHCHPSFTSVITAAIHSLQAQLILRGDNSLGYGKVIFSGPTSSNAEGDITGWAHDFDGRA